MCHAAYRAEQRVIGAGGEHSRTRTARSAATSFLGPLALSVLAGAIESCATSYPGPDELARSTDYARYANDEGPRTEMRADESAASFELSSADKGPQQTQPNVVYVQQPPQVVYVQQPPPVVVVRPVMYGPLAAKPGFYLTASATGVTAGGDLDGHSAIFGPATVFLPDVDAGAGFEVGGGFRSPADAFEITYDRSDHTGSFQGMPLDSTIEAINFDWKHFFHIEKKLQPYTLFGMNFPWMNIEDGARRLSQTGDATLYGVGLNLGGGAAYYLTPQLSISLQGVFQLIDYFEVSALGFNGGTDVFSDGWKLSLGTAFTF